MPELLTTGCLLTCSLGLAPSVFAALEIPGKPTVDGMTAAWYLETAPAANIPPFGMCRAQDNPTVIAATLAAQGAPMPGACTPLIAVPWTPPSAVLKYLDIPLATVASKCVCTYGGEISVLVPVAATAQSG